MGLIYLDTCLLIYLNQRHPHWGTAVGKAMLNATGARFAISPLVKAESLVGPLKQQDAVMQQAFEALFERFVSLDIPESVFIAAAHLRARFNLKTPDALHLACAQHHRCDALWTNDNRLTQAGHGLAINILP